MDPLQRGNANQQPIQPEQDRAHEADFADEARQDDPFYNPWAPSDPSPAGHAAAAPAERERSAERPLPAPEERRSDSMEIRPDPRPARLEVPGDGDGGRRSASASGHSDHLFAAVSRDHPGVLPVLEGEVAGHDAVEQVPDDFAGEQHYEKFGGRLTSNRNNGFISASENSGTIDLTRNRNGLTVTNNDGRILSRGAQRGAVEHVENQNGLYHVSGGSNGRHNVVNNRQTVQIGDRNGAGLGEHGQVEVSGRGKVEFWHPNKTEPEVRYLHNETMTFTRRGAPNVVQRAANWAAENPGKAGALGVGGAVVGGLGTGAIYANNAAAIIPSGDAARTAVEGTTSAVTSAASSETARAAAKTAAAAASETAKAATDVKLPGR